MPKPSSGWRGVSVRRLDPVKWAVKVTISDVGHYTGMYDTAEEAARVYDLAVSLIKDGTPR